MESVKLDVWESSRNSETLIMKARKQPNITMEIVIQRVWPSGALKSFGDTAKCCPKTTRQSTWVAVLVRLSIQFKKQIYLHWCLPPSLYHNVLNNIIYNCSLGVKSFCILILLARENLKWWKNDAYCFKCRLHVHCSSCKHLPMSK